MPKFHLTPKQAFAYLKLTDKTSKEIGYGGGAGGGKSILGCLWLLTNCLQYPRTKWVMGRKELTNLKKTTLLSFFQVVQILGLKGEDLFNLNSQTNIITFKNGSMIFLMDMSHQPSDPLYTRFGGLELTGAFVDESNEDNYQAIEILKTRLGRGLNKEHGLIPKLLETFNPDKGHVYRRYYKPWKEGKLSKHVIFIPALATDNKYLDDSYIEQLRNIDCKVTRERLLLGNFDYDDDPAKLFEYDKILDIFSNQWEDKPRRQNYLTCDVARMGRDKTVIMVWYGLHIHRVLSFPKTTTTQVRDLIINNCHKYKIPFSNVMIDEDGVGGGVVDMLKEIAPQIHGFINGSSPVETKISKLRHNYQNLKTQCYFKLAKLVENNEITCYDVDSEIKELMIADLEQVAQKDIDKDGKIKLLGKDEIKEKLGRSPDFSDAMCMRMRFELVKTYKPYLAR